MSRSTPTLSVVEELTYAGNVIESNDLDGNVLLFQFRSEFLISTFWSFSLAVVSSKGSSFLAKMTLSLWRTLLIIISSWISSQLSSRVQYIKRVVCFENVLNLNLNFALMRKKPVSNENQ